jgi:serine O-acetyltransferase
MNAVVETDDASSTGEARRAANPIRPATLAEQSDRPSPSKDGTAEATPRGSTNQNPDGIGFLALLAEDIRTHEYQLVHPGLWAILLHRFGNWRMGIRSRWLRAPLTLIYRVLFRLLVLFFTVDISYVVKLGRRVRIWHHGGIFIMADSIGDDVWIRQNVAMGVLNRHDTSAAPIIEDRVDIYSGVCIAGNVRVGEGSMIGANSVITTDVPPDTVMFGNPARRVPGQRSSSRND